MLRVSAIALAALIAAATPAAAADSGSAVDVVVGYADGSHEVERVDAGRVADVLEAAAAAPGVAFAEVDVTMRAFDVVPRDPRWPEQWGAPLVGAPAAWDRTRGDESVVVAVVDTGVDRHHEDLAGVVLEGIDLVDGGPVGDPHGHGTAVAGVIAAGTDNGVGTAGYCWTCRILPVRVLGADGTGPSSVIAEGIRWAADNGADVINLSLGAPKATRAIDAAVEHARSQDVVVVASAGNHGTSQRSWPAASTGVVGVAGSDRGDERYEWSSFGPWVPLAAPGCALTTVGRTYETVCGTSIAAPAVSGMVALARAAFPAARADDIAGALHATARPVGPFVAHGRLDGSRFLDRLASSFGPGVRGVDRVAGADRIATSVSVSRRVHASATDVVIARADAYADALAAAPLAGQLAAPILLSTPGSLPADVTAEIRRLGARSAHLVGGEGALSPRIVADLRAIGVTRVTRLAGEDRAATAALVAWRVAARGRAYVAAMHAWPDAVAVSPLAAATGRPILLVGRDHVPAATVAAIRALGLREIDVVGGTAVVSDAVVAELGRLGAVVRRHAGTDRYETSVVLAGAAVAEGARAARTWIASGVSWPDALAAGPAVARRHGVLLLAPPVIATGSATGRWMQGLRSEEVVAVGGEAALPTSVVGRLSAGVR